VVLHVFDRAVFDFKFRCCNSDHEAVNLHIQDGSPRHLKFLRNLQK
jgi:hypothetical protein